MFPRSSVRRPPVRSACVRVLEGLESRLAPAATNSATTYIDEVVTNTPVVTEQFATRVVAGGPNATIVFDQTLPVAYDPANPSIVAATASAVLAATAATAGVVPVASIQVVTSATVVLGGPVAVRTYPQTYRVLTAADPTLIETGRTETVVATDVVQTPGPATVRTGLNGAESLFVPAGDTHSNTITRIRRDIRTRTAETYTTTQFVLAADVTNRSAGTSLFTTSTRTFPLQNVTNVTATREAHATRVVGTFQGVRYDVTLTTAYRPDA